jgi:hypothetical protein
MKIAVIEAKWNEFRLTFSNRWNKRRNDQLIKINRAQERSISILQKRYGYTREQATSEFNQHYSHAWLG